MAKSIVERARVAAQRSIVAALTDAADRGIRREGRLGLHEQLCHAADQGLQDIRDAEVLRLQGELAKDEQKWRENRARDAIQRQAILADRARELAALTDGEVEQLAQRLDQAVDMDYCDLLCARLVAAGSSIAIATRDLVRQRMGEWGTRKPWLQDNAHLAELTALQGDRASIRQLVALPSELPIDTGVPS